MNAILIGSLRDVALNIIIFLNISGTGVSQWVSTLLNLFNYTHYNWVLEIGSTCFAFRIVVILDNYSKNSTVFLLH